MECKFCGAELEEENSLCPACGKDNAGEAAPVEEVIPTEEPVAEEAAEEAVQQINVLAEEPVMAQPKKKGKVVAAVIGCVVLLIALAVAVFYGVNGGFEIKENNVYFKDSYSVDDETAIKQANKVVASVGDHKLTNRQLQLQYWMQFYDLLNYYAETYGEYMSYFLPVDYTQPLDAQTIAEDGTTWQHSFVELALQSWHSQVAVNILAKDAGFEISAELREALDAMPAQMEAVASQNGFSSVDELIQSEMGPGCTLDDYMAYMELSYLGTEYLNSEIGKLNPTDEEISAYFDENAAEFEASGITKDSGKMYDVRHILIQPQGGVTDNTTGLTTYSEDEWAACLTEAQGVLDLWLLGDKNEASFAQLAMLYSQDGNASSGGLYSGLTADTNFVTEFKDWYMDESRQVGDYGLVQTQYGYHIMYFSASEEMWYAYALNSLLTEHADELVASAMAAHPMEVKYRNIVLGVVEFN